MAALLSEHGHLFLDELGWGLLEKAKTLGLARNKKEAEAGRYRQSIRAETVNALTGEKGAVVSLSLKFLSYIRR